MSLACKDLARKLYRFGKISRHLAQSGQEKIAKAVTAKVAVAGEAVPEQARQQARILAQSDHAVANIAWRQHLQLVSQAARTPAIVGDGNDRRQVLTQTGSRSGALTNRFRPASTVDKPLPPPMATRSSPAGVSEKTWCFI